MNEKEFNLLYEPWIPVLRKDGGTEEVGLRDLVVNAHQYERIASELPPLDLAILRVALAVLYRVYLPDDRKDIDELDDAVDLWASIWRSGSFDAEAVDSYLSRYEDRFYLFHPTRPFFQAPIKKGTDYSASKLIGSLSESENKPRLFAPISGKSKDSVSYSEAARWLLYLNAYDDTSSKPTVRKSGLPSVGAGWLGKIGPTYFRGSDLFETLMLNFPLIDVNTLEPFPKDEATWEPENPRMQERSEIPIPQSPAALLTLQSRRILLRREGSRVTGCLVMGGDFFQKENALIEYMTPWKIKKDCWEPRRHDPSRMVWRDFSSLLTESDDTKSPGVVRWFRKLVSRGIIGHDSAHIVITGVNYDKKGSVVTDIIHDELSLNAALLSELGYEWRVRIVKSLSKTETCVGHLGNFAKNIAIASGRDEKNKSINAVVTEARESAYHELDLRFRQWLDSIDPDVDDIDERINEWEDQMRGCLKSMSEDMVKDAGLKAIIGKDMENNAISRQRLFMNSVNKTLREE